MRHLIGIGLVVGVLAVLIGVKGAAIPVSLIGAVFLMMAFGFPISAPPAVKATTDDGLETDLEVAI